MASTRGVIVTKWDQGVGWKLLRLGAALVTCGVCACGADTGADPGSSALDGRAEQGSVDLRAAGAPTGTLADGNTSTPDPSQGGGGVTLSAVSPQSVQRAREACSATPTGIRKASSKGEFEQMILGVWWLCNSPSMFGTQEAGLLIEDDGRWAKLASSGGTLAALSGWGNEGSWDVIDTSVMNGPGVYQLDFDIDGSGGIGSIPDIAQQPDLIRMDNEGVFHSDYVRVQ